MNAPPPYAGLAASSWEMFGCECEYHLTNGATAEGLAQVLTCKEHPRASRHSFATNSDNRPRALPLAQARATTLGHDRAVEGGTETA